VDVFATGFDAPSINAVCIAKPTTSAIKDEQMGGRGLRGLKNGRTDKCLIVDVQSKGLPDSIMSYARVAAMWNLEKSDGENLSRVESLPMMEDVGLSR